MIEASLGDVFSFTSLASELPSHSSYAAEGTELTDVASLIEEALIEVVEVSS